MKVPEDVQFVYRNGEPCYAVIPYQDYLEYLRQVNAMSVLPPRPTPSLSPLTDPAGSLLATWRRLQGISQAEMARRLGIEEADIVRLEATGMRRMTGRGPT
jgi:hypothetical protein